MGEEVFNFNFKSIEEIELPSYPGRNNVLCAIFVCLFTGSFAIYLGFVIPYGEGTVLLCMTATMFLIFGFRALFHNLNLHDSAVFRPEKIIQVSLWGHEDHVCMKEEIMAIVLHKYHSMVWYRRSRVYQHHYYLSIKIYLTNRKTVTLKHLLYTDNRHYINHWETNLKKYCQKYYKIKVLFKNHDSIFHGEIYR